MTPFSPSQRYYLYRGAADMRKSFDGLCGLVRRELDRDPASGAYSDDLGRLVRLKSATHYE